MASVPVHAPPARPLVLIVDDEPDVHSVTRLSLKGLRHGGNKLRFLEAHSGAEALEQMREHPDVAVVLLDVVMETDQAGLEACRAIREELGNTFVRVLLRTGQPGVAPERETIDGYDIDGYLPKEELTANRLHVAVRTAIRAWEQIIELERHRRSLAIVHDCAISLRSFEGTAAVLDRILEAAVALCPTDLAVFVLETFGADGDATKLVLHLAAEQDPVEASGAAAAVATKLATDAEARGAQEPTSWNGGLLLPVTLHRDLGYGWIHLDAVEPDALTEQVLSMLVAHGRNALYSSVAEKMLADRSGPLFDTLSI